MSCTTNITYGVPSLSFILAAGMKNEYSIHTPWESIVTLSLCSFYKKKRKNIYICADT